MTKSLRSVVGPAVVLCLCCLVSSAVGQETTMRVRAGFDGNCKESEWVPIAIDLSNRGPEVAGVLEVVAPNPDGRTRTTFRRPVVLGSKARQTVFLYVRGLSYLGRPSVSLLSGRSTVDQQSPSANWLSPEDNLVVVLGRERGTLAFLSGTGRLASSVQNRPMGPGGSSGGGQSQLHVADGDPDALPDLPQGYASVDLLVIEDIAPESLRPEVKEAITKWVLGGGTLVVMGGPDWARLKDPFYDQLLPAKVTGAAELTSLRALGERFGAPLSGSALVSRATPQPGATVRLWQGDVPLIVEGAAGSGRVVFLAFDATRAPFKGWSGQKWLWNGVLDSAQAATPLLAPILAGSQSYGPYNLRNEPLVSAVLDVPSMKVPPFWWVAFFLLAYVVLLVPVNYATLKWRRRREMAWLTTPAIVVLFVILAYGIGYSMKGGKLLANQLSVIETRAGARAARVVTYAGVFSPAKTSYDVSADDRSTTISESPLDVSSGRMRDLDVLEADGMSLPGVTMDMWSMRVFKMEGLADLKDGVQSDLTVTSNGRVAGTVTNRTGTDLTNCEVRVGKARWRGDVANGQTVQIGIDAGVGKPRDIVAMQPNPYQYGQGQGSYSSAIPLERMRARMNDVLFGQGQSAKPGSTLVFTGWTDSRFAQLVIDGKPSVTSSYAFLIVHLPLSLPRSGAVLVPYGMSEGVVVDEQGTYSQGWDQPGLMLSDGYVVKEFRLPASQATLGVSGLEVSCNYDSGGAPAKAKLQVYNWKTAAWDTLPVSRGRIPVASAAAHVLSPQGLVQVKFVNHPGGGASSGTGATGGMGRGGFRRGGGGMSGGGGPEVRLLALDVLVRGRL